MRNSAFFAPLGPVMGGIALGAIAVGASGMAAPGVALAEPSQSQRAPEITVSIGGDLTEQVPKLGERDVQRQSDELADAVRTALSRSGALAGAQVHLVLTDLKPNRPTFQQAVDKPGLSIFDSISIGGATIEGEVITADGERLPVRYSRYSSSIEDVYGYDTWQDASRAYDRLADNLAEGRLVSR
ncbi:hypothetical protein BH10PSE2_BH10PSE2_29840 [soil metagenome]